MQESKIQPVSSLTPQAQMTQATQDVSPKLDLSIEGMRSQQFSQGVFAFLMVGVALFSVIVIILLFGKHRPKNFRIGEKIMFSAVVLGIVAAVVFATLQMLDGFLF